MASMIAHISTALGTGTLTDTQYAKTIRTIPPRKLPQGIRGRADIHSNQVQFRRP